MEVVCVDFYDCCPEFVVLFSANNILLMDSMNAFYRQRDNLKVLTCSASYQLHKVELDS